MPVLKLDAVSGFASHRSGHRPPARWRSAHLRDEHRPARIVMQSVKTDVAHHLGRTRIALVVGALQQLEGVVVATAVCRRDGQDVRRDRSSREAGMHISQRRFGGRAPTRCGWAPAGGRAATRVVGRRRTQAGIENDSSFRVAACHREHCREAVGRDAVRRDVAHRFDFERGPPRPEAKQRAGKPTPTNTCLWPPRA